MKNFNIFGVHGKIRVLRGFQEKPIYRGGGGSPKSGGARGGGGLVFLSGGVITQCTLCYQFDYFNSLTPVVY